VLRRLLACAGAFAVLGAPAGFAQIPAAVDFSPLLPGTTRRSPVIRKQWRGSRLRVTVVALTTGGRASATTAVIRDR
jgi:hypothetical protein